MLQRRDLFAIFMLKVPGKTSYFYTMNNLLQKQKTDFMKKLISTQHKCERNYQIKEPSYLTSRISPKHAQTVISVNKNLFCSYSSKNMFSIVRNFSTSSVVRLPDDRSLQDKEKQKNYIYGTLLAAVTLLVIFVNLTLKKHEDYVYVAVEENK